MQNDIAGQLKQYFKDRGIRPAEVAESLGYAYTYVINMLNGDRHISDSARMRFVEGYPETAAFLLDVRVRSAVAEERVEYKAGGPA